ncbi:hypothetical protein V492_02108 [Pseudogymnoascus sp. VKM F-4246]|nr:hypothetical protein V492_02108 [Pseudogymnoascus sp. VKM F-4246]
MTSLNSDEMRAIDQTRTRLDQLTKSIGALKNDILRSPVMPPIDSIQVHSTILAQSLKNITDHLSKHSDLFSQTVVYPSTNFPGRTQEGLIGQLLRKKLEPSAESWVEEGRALGKPDSEGAGRDEDLDELWSFAKEYVLPQVAKAAQLSRSSLDDIYAESDEEDEEEEEEGEGGGGEKAHAENGINLNANRKLTIVGIWGSRKTSLLQAALQGQYPPKEQQPFETCPGLYTCTVLNEAGEIRRSNSHCGIQRWLPQVDYSAPGVPIVLVGLRKDTRDKPDIDGSKKATFISTEMGDRLAHKIGAFAFVECSSFNGEGVSEVFEAAARAAIYGPPRKVKKKRKDRRWAKCVVS